MTLNEIRKKRAKHWEEMKNFLDAHTRDDGTLNADDTATYENFNAKMNEYDAALERAENRLEMEAKLNKPDSEPLVDGFGGTDKTGRASDEYNANFTAYIRSRGAKNVLQEGVSADGGYLVPTEFERVLYRVRDSIDPIFSLAGRISLGSLEKVVPYVASEGAAALVAENAAFPVTNDQFGSVLFHAYKFGRIVLASDELIADAAFDIYTYAAESLGRSMGKGQAPYMWTGTGTNQPQGVLTAAGAGVTAAATGAVTADEIIDLYYSLKDEYRNSATWAMHNNTVRAIRKLKLTGTGEYLWSPGLGTAPDTILGRPLVTSPNIPEMAASAKAVAFGDFAAGFKIADRQGFEFKILAERYSDLGQIGFRGAARTDSRGVLANEAIKVLTMKAS